MAADDIHAAPDEEESVESKVSLRLLLVAGLFVYLSVTSAVWLLQKDVGELEDGRWLGKENTDFAYDHGPPEEVEEDGQGGNILKYLQLEVVDGRFKFERFNVFVDQSGVILDIQPEPAGE